VREVRCIVPAEADRASAEALPVCTPRSDEDGAAAPEHWAAQVHTERQKDRNARAREQMRSLEAKQSRAMRERIRGV
jgi:hypothetical protein